MIRIWLTLLLLCPAIAFAAEEPATTRPAPGQKVGMLEFKDIRFLARTLDDFGPKKAFVIVATSGDCPVARRYLPVLNALEKSYRDRGVQFVALNVGPDDTITEMAADAVESGVEFPVVKDFGLRSARALGVSRTPEAVVLDADRVLRYRGRIDDQFRVSGDRPDAIRPALRAALDDVLAGRTVAQAETPVDGCLIAFQSAATTPTSTTPPTFAEHVATIFQKHCQDCHHAGTEAPFPLVSYRDALVHAEMIAEVIDDRRMPPWFASARHGTFSNQRGLSADERETVLDWVRSGSPKGDLTKQPAPRTFSTGRWRIGTPDLVTTTPLAQSIPATGYVDYRHVVFPYVFARDTWVQAIEILPDNPRIVHHANLGYLTLGAQVREENFLTGRVPGGDPMVLDEGTAVLIPKGSIIGLQIHLTTTGKPESTRISVGLKYPRGPVHKRLYHQQVHTNRFQIPPFAPFHPVTASRKLDFDATGIGVFSHMHVRGKDMTFLARLPDGAVDTLLLIPNYNFDWQQSYRWPMGSKKFPKGTTLEVLAHFDNSAFNPFNPDPKVAVGVGSQTFNEMVYGFYFYTRDDEDLNLVIDPKTGGALAEHAAR
jgi:Redoxin